MKLTRGGGTIHRSKAFTTQTVNSYSPRVEYHVQKMILILKELGGKEVDVVNIFSYLAFDMYAPWSPVL